MLLHLIGEEIWIAEGSIVDFYGFPYSTRCVIVRFDTTKLWIWSPITLTGELKTAVDDLGEVVHLVSPNKIHQLFLSDWHDAYPGALLWGPASTIGKRADLGFQPPLEETAPAQWEGAFEQFWFTGSLALDEVVFFHTASKTAIFADLTENFSDEFLAQHWSPWKRWIARIWKIKEPWGFAPLELRLSWTRRKKAREALSRLLNLKPERVVMAHGEWQSTNGTEYIRQAFSWLL